MAHCKMNSSLDKCGSTVSCRGCHQYERDAPDAKVITPSTSSNTQRDAICPKSAVLRGNNSLVCIVDGDPCTGIVGACNVMLSVIFVRQLSVNILTNIGY